MWELNTIVNFIAKIHHLFFTMEALRNFNQLTNIFLFEATIYRPCGGNKVLGKQFLPHESFCISKILNNLKINFLSIWYNSRVYVGEIGVVYFL